MSIIDLVSQLRRDEGLRLRPYRDQVGKLTIGIGRNLDDDGISEEEADFLLANDIKNTQVSLFAALPWTVDLDEARQGVLLNMAFNMGLHGLMQFKGTLALVETGDYAGAAQAMLESEWAKQVGPRAQRLSIQMDQGTWQ